MSLLETMLIGFGVVCGLTIVLMGFSNLYDDSAFQKSWKECDFIQIIMDISAVILIIAIVLGLHGFSACYLLANCKQIENFNG